MKVTMNTTVLYRLFAGVATNIFPAVLSQGCERGSEARAQQEKSESAPCREQDAPKIKQNSRK